MRFATYHRPDMTSITTSLSHSDSTHAAQRLVENLSALWATDPSLALRIDQLHESEEMDLLPTRSGHQTAWVGGKTRPILLASKYDPVDEAQQLVRSIPDQCHELFVRGMGLGYHVEKLNQSFPNATCWVFEPDVRVIRSAFRCVDLSQAILDHKVRLITELDKSRLFPNGHPTWQPFRSGIMSLIIPLVCSCKPISYSKPNNC